MKPTRNFRLRPLRWCAGFLAATLACPAAQAHVTLTTFNVYYPPTRAVWITIYDLGKLRHLDWGCMAVSGKRDWASGKYLYGSFYYIRGEVKENADCSGRTLCDTTIQATPGYFVNPGTAVSGTSMAYDTQYRIKKNGNNCYWESVNPANPHKL